MSELSKKVICKKYGSESVVLQAKQYIDDRRKGRITSLKTKFKKLDSSLMGGIELNTILCISAMSGAGKSTFSKDIRDSFVVHNPNQKFKQYVFNFEMVSFQQISRSLSTDTDTALRDLYSVDKPLSDEDFLKLEEHFDRLSKRDVQFIEVPNLPEVIANSIVHYWKTECEPIGATMVYEIDHALLVKGGHGKSEKDRIDDLMYALVEVKKYISAQGGNSIGLVLSQMNREIKSTERRHNADMHRVDTSCLFGASSIEMCSDYIAFIHIPAKLNIVSYTDNNLPTRMKVNDKILQIPYLELVKQRSGASDLTIPLWNKLDRFTFDEMEKAIFTDLHKSFIENGCGGIPEIK
jgi:hypothetical protein